MRKLLSRGSALCLTVCVLLLLTAAKVDGGNAFASSSDTSTTSAHGVYLPTIPSLTFTSSAFTSPRRHPPRSQLECVSGTARSETSLQPAHVDCYNTPTKNEDPKTSDSQPVKPSWRCVAQLNRRVVMEDATVKCEGWNGDEDMFVVPGSCWLEYALVYAAPGGKMDDVAAGKGANAKGDSVPTGAGAVYIIQPLIGAVLIAFLLSRCFSARQGHVDEERVVEQSVRTYDSIGTHREG